MRCAIIDQCSLNTVIIWAFPESLGTVVTHLTLTPEIIITFFFSTSRKLQRKHMGHASINIEANIRRERSPGRLKIAFHRILGLQMSCVFPSFVPSVHSQNVVKFPYMFCGSNFSGACHKREGTKYKKLTRLKQDERASPEIQKCVSWYLP